MLTSHSGLSSTIKTANEYEISWHLFDGGGDQIRYLQVGISMSRPQLFIYLGMGLELVIIKW